MKLEDEGIAVVAVSGDSLDALKAHEARDGLPITLLSDPGFRVIERFGLLHEAHKMETFDVLGVPLGYPVGKKRMAIPTTLLVDEEGIVRWIDQADDYRMRGDEERVRAGIREAFEG